MSGTGSVGRQPYIALEGINGAGKSGLRDSLETAFWTAGAQLYLLGQQEWLIPAAARIILDTKERRHRYPTAVIRQAYLQDRISQSNEILNPMLRTVPVLGDRSAISDAVYLEALDGIPAHETSELYRNSGIRFPDLIIHVSVDPEVALRRVIARARDRKPHENSESMASLAESYENLLWRNRPAYFPPVRRLENNNRNSDLIGQQQALIRQLIDDWKENRIIRPTLTSSG